MPDPQLTGPGLPHRMGGWGLGNDWGRTYRCAVEEAALAGNFSKDKLPPWVKPYGLWGKLKAGPEAEKEAIARRGTRSFLSQYSIYPPCWALNCCLIQG